VFESSYGVLKIRIHCSPSTILKAVPKAVPQMG
jgi:hypothetical protein